VRIPEINSDDHADEFLTVGLELVKQLSALPASQVSVVFAAIRSDPPASLQRVIDASNGRVHPVKVEIVDTASVNQAVAVVSDHLGGKGLDVLLNNAGAMPFVSGGTNSLEKESFMETFEINVAAVQIVTAAFLPLLRKGTEKKIVNM
jgi:NAD(P)-dependent dehydrogenase (short-subunit alcohol dehydrogenase family)